MSLRARLARKEARQQQPILEALALALLRLGRELEASQRALRAAQAELHQARLEAQEQAETVRWLALELHVAAQLRRGLVP